MGLQPISKFLIHLAPFCLPFRKAFSVLLPLIAWCAPRQDAGVGVALLIPMAASVDLLEDPIPVSHCRDITSEG